MGLLRKAASGSLWVSISLIVTSGLQIAQLALLARILGSSSMGIITLSTVLMTFIDTIVTMGISNSIIQRTTASPSELSSLYWLNQMVGAFSSIAMLLASPFLTDFFDEPQLKPLLWCTSAVFLISSSGQVSRGLLERDLKFAQVAASEITQYVVMLIISVTLSSRYGVVGYGIGLISGYLVKTIVLLTTGRFLFLPTVHFAFRETKRFLSFGIYQSLDSLTSFTVNNAASVIIGKLATASQLGLYNVSFTFAVNTPAKLNSIMTRTLFPTLTKVVHNRPIFNKGVQLLVETAGYLSVPILATLAFESEDFLNVVFGESWTEATPIMQMLCIVGITRAFANPMGIVLMALNEMRLGFWINIAKGVATLALVLYFTNNYDAYGAALAYALAGILTIFVNYVIYITVAKMRLLPLLAMHSLPILAFLPSMICILFTMTALSNTQPLVRLILVSIMSGILYASTVFIIRRPLVMEVARKIKHKSI